jgi:hypothetical protein
VLRQVIFREMLLSVYFRLVGVKHIQPGTRHCLPKIIRLGQAGRTLATATRS